MGIVAIVQARSGSTRFPNKVFAEIDGMPLIWHVVNRLSYAETIDEVVVATTVNDKDDRLEEWCCQNAVSCYRGSEDDVLSRYYEAATAYSSDIVVRITADDPFKEPTVIDDVVTTLVRGDYDLVTNNFPPSFPEGLDCEALTYDALQRSARSTASTYEREHVTQYIYHNPETFRIGNVSSERMLSSYRWTIDTREDYMMVKAVYDNRPAGNGGILLMDEILQILDAHPDISTINSDVARSAMYR